MTINNQLDNKITFSKEVLETIFSHLKPISLDKNKKNCTTATNYKVAFHLLAENLSEEKKGICKNIITGNLSKIMDRNEYYHNNLHNMSLQLAKLFENELTVIDNTNVIMNLCGRIGDVQKTYRALNNMIPNFNDFVIEAFHNKNANIYENIDIFDVICTAILPIEKKLDKSPAFLKNLKYMSMNHEFSKVIHIAEVLAKVDNSCNTKSELFEQIAIFSNKEISYLKWREKFPEFDEIQEVSDKTFFSKIATTRIYSTTIETEKIAYFTKTPVPIVKSMEDIIFTYISDISYGEVNQIRDKHNSRIEFIEKSYCDHDAPYSPDKLINERYKETQSLVKNLVTYADNHLLRGYAKGFKKLKTTSEKVATAKMFVNVLSTLLDNDGISKHLDSLPIPEEIKDAKSSNNTPDTFKI